MKYLEYRYKYMRSGKYVSNFHKLLPKLPGRNWWQALLNAEPTLHLINHNQGLQFFDDLGLSHYSQVSMI